MSDKRKRTYVKGSRSAKTKSIKDIDLVLNEVLSWYPEDIFPPDGTSKDAASARAIRHIVGVIRKMLCEEY